MSDESIVVSQTVRKSEESSGQINENQTMFRIGPSTLAQHSIKCPDSEEGFIESSEAIHRNSQANMAIHSLPKEERALISGKGRGWRMVLKLMTSIDH